MPPTDAQMNRAESLAIEALMFLAQDEGRLSRYLALTGLEGQDLRAAAASPGFLASVMEYLAQDESLLIAFASEKGLTPEAVMRLAGKLGGQQAPREGHWRESW